MEKVKDHKAGEAYAKLLLIDEGQQLIQQAGYVPIRGQLAVSSED